MIYDTQTCSVPIQLVHMLLKGSTEEALTHCVDEKMHDENDRDFLLECIPVLLFIREHAIRKPSLREIADRSLHSELYFQKLFSRAFGMSPHDVCELIRLEYSKTLLMKNMRQIDIAPQCGYSQYGYYKRRFMRRYGMSPIAWRQKQQRAIQK